MLISVGKKEREREGESWNHLATKAQAHSKQTFKGSLGPFGSQGPKMLKMSSESSLGSFGSQSPKMLKISFLKSPWDHLAAKAQKCLK